MMVCIAVEVLHDRAKKRGQPSFWWDQPHFIPWSLHPSSSPNAVACRQWVGERVNCLQIEEHYGLELLATVWGCYAVMSSAAQNPRAACMLLLMYHALP